MSLTFFSISEPNKAKLLSFQSYFLAFLRPDMAARNFLHLWTTRRTSTGKRVKTHLCKNFYRRIVIRDWFKQPKYLSRLLSIMSDPQGALVNRTNWCNNCNNFCSSLGLFIDPLPRVCVKWTRLIFLVALESKLETSARMQHGRHQWWKHAPEILGNLVPRARITLVRWNGTRGNDGERRDWTRRERHQSWWRGWEMGGPKKFMQGKNAKKKNCAKGKAKQKYSRRTKGPMMGSIIYLFLSRKLKIRFQMRLANITSNYFLPYADECRWW